MKTEYYAKFFPFLLVLSILARLLMTTAVVAQSQRYEAGFIFREGGREGQNSLNRLPSALVGKEIYIESIPPADFEKVSPYDGEINVWIDVTLQWLSSEGASSYEYCYDTSDDDDCSNWVSTGAATEAALSGLAVVTTYYWQVRAINGSGTTYANGESGYWHFTTEAPPPPGEFTKESPAPGTTDYFPSVTLNWAGSPSAESYEYCYDTSDDDACSNWVSTGTATEVTLSELMPGTYYWQVRAVNPGGATYAEGGYWHFTKIPPPAPGEFYKKSPVPGTTNLDPENVTLDWKGSPSANYYEYCYDTSDDDACSNWVSTGSATEVTLSGLALGTTYYWQVRAVNTGGTTYADGGYWHFSTEYYMYYLPLMVNE